MPTIQPPPDLNEEDVVWMQAQLEKMVNFE
jgi:hypothetical protein